MICLDLPPLPSANRYWRSIVIPGQKHAQTYVGDEGKAYRRTLSQLAMAQRWPRGLTVRLSFRAICFEPDRRARDLDNLLKALFDALKSPRRPKDVGACLFVDDSQIDRLELRRGPVVPGGLIHLTLAQIPAEDLRPNVGEWLE